MAWGESRHGPLRIRAVGLLALVWLGAAAPASAAPPMRGQLSLSTGGSIYEPSLVLGLEGGLRWGWFGVAAKLDWNPWITTQEQDMVELGALNVGAGVEFLYFGGRCRSAVFFGPSILLFETALDQPGATGVFLDIHAVELRWPLSGRFTLKLAPITFHLVMPVMSGIPLAVLEYRHTVGVEVSL